MGKPLKRPWSSLVFHYVQCPTCKKLKKREGDQGEVIRIFKNNKHTKVVFETCKLCMRRSTVKEVADRIARSKELEEKFSSIVCEIGEVCPTLHAHHDLLIDDPERLTTEFCIQLTCGEDGLRRYYQKKDK